MNNSGYIRGFDGLRAISVLLVLLAHGSTLYDHLPEHDLYRVRLYALFSGETGVLVFFAISGFLITHLLLKEKERTGTINVGHFLIRRFLRLMPVLLVFLMVVVVLSQAGIIAVNSMALMAAGLYFFNFLPHTYNVVELTHTWSLGVEEQFYLLWPMGLKYLRNVTFTKIAWMLLIFCGIVLVTMHQWTIYGSPQQQQFMQDYRPMRWFIPAIAPVVAGALASLLWNNKHARFMRWTNGKDGWVLFAVLFFSPVYLPDPIFRLHYLFQGIAVAVLLSKLMEQQDALLTSVLEFSPLRFIGRISYGIYIWQGLFLRTGPGSEMLFQQFPFNILLTLVVAILSFYLLEKPLQKWRARYR